MKCDELRENLSAFLAGENAEAENAAARDHLAECDECRALAREVQLTVQAVRALPSVPPPPELRRRIHHAVRTQAKARQPARPWWRLWAPAVSAAAAVALLMVGVGTMMTARKHGYMTEQAGDAFMAQPATRAKEEMAERPAARSGGYFDEAAPGMAGAPGAGGRLEERDSEAADAFGSEGMVAALPSGAPHDAAEAEDVAEGIGHETRAAKMRGGGPAVVEWAPPKGGVAGRVSQVGVTVTADADMYGATIVVVPSRELEVVSPADNVVYRGDLKANEQQQFVVGVNAQRPGDHRLRLEIRSDQPPASQTLETRVSYGAVPVVDLAARGMVLADAAKELRRQTATPINVDPSLRRRRVSATYRQEPLDSALTGLATQVGAEVSNDAAGWNIRPQPAASIEAAAEPAAAH